MTPSPDIENPYGAFVPGDPVACDGAGDCGCVSLAEQAAPADARTAADRRRCHGNRRPCGSRRAGPGHRAAPGAFPASEDIVLASEGLPVWKDRQRRLQQVEFAATSGDWIDRTNPRFSFEVGRSLALAALLTQADVVGDRVIIVTLTCVAGLTGLPQINLPLAETPDGVPAGLSLIGWRGGDAALLALAARL